MLDKLKAECDIRLFFKLKQIGMQGLKEHIKDRVKELPPIPDEKKRPKEVLRFNSPSEKEAIRLADSAEFQYFKMINQKIHPIYAQISPIEQEVLRKLYDYHGYLRNGRRADRDVSEELGLTTETVKNIRLDFAKKVAIEMNYFEIKLSV